MNKPKRKSKFRVLLAPFLSWKFLISYAPIYVIVNGWAWVGSAMLAMGINNWFTKASIAWFIVLWNPLMLEKLFTIPIAMALHTKLFKNDPKTREKLEVMYAEVLADKNKIKKFFKDIKEKRKMRKQRKKEFNKTIVVEEKYLLPLKEEEIKENEKTE